MKKLNKEYDVLNKKHLTDCKSYDNSLIQNKNELNGILKNLKEYENNFKIQETNLSSN